MRILLRAHRARVAAVGVPEARLLHDALAGPQRLRLAADLELEGALDVPERVHVLDLDLRAELAGAARPKRHVRVAAQRPLLHVAAGDAEVDQHSAERLEVRGSLLGRAQVGLGDGFHERNA